MEQQNESHKKEKQQLNAYAKYSSVGFQMISIIGVFAFAGYKLDESQKTKTSIYTGILSLIGVFISIYIVIKSLK